MSLVLIPAVMGLVILLVGNNLVRVFSLAGTVSLIRYRSVPGDPKDIAYILFMRGRACGWNRILFIWCT